jgi:tRNA-splicing ligase RtcB
VQKKVNLLYVKGMTIKQQAQKVSVCQYVLPRSGTMRVNASVFLSDELYTASEQKMWGQIVNAASQPGITAIYIMPDCHAGFGVPIGTVAVTDGTILQCAAGYDIGCGMALMRVKGARRNAVKGKYERRRWITEVEKRVALGVGTNRPKLMAAYTDELLEDIFRHGSQAVGVDTGKCERSFLPVSSAFDSNKIEKARRNALGQLSSLGGGNHYLELLYDKNDDSVWMMIHTGSRGYGWQTAEHFFFEGARLRGIPSNRREDSWVDVFEPLGQQYIDYHNSAGNYASANRHLICKAVAEATQEVFAADCELFYEISHNLVQQESNGFVHRKGATRAFPVIDGLPLEGAGHPCLIPGSMYEGAAVLTPLPDAAKSGFSVNHGSGRVMGRNEAKKKLSHKQLHIDEKMNTVQRGGIEGIMINTRHTPIDECSEVYKDLDTVLNVLVEEKIAKIDRRLYPIACIKGND